jgi:hypothetical protein
MEATIKVERDPIFILTLRMTNTERAQLYAVLMGSAGDDFIDDILNVIANTGVQLE